MSEAASNAESLKSARPGVPATAYGGAELARFARNCAVFVLRFWQWLCAKRQAQIASRRLRICEQIQLGEKRFVAIIQVDKEQFLLGGSSSNLVLLGQLEADPHFLEVLQKQQERS